MPFFVNGSDDYETPNWVLDVILDRIPKKKKLYDPFYCNGESGRHMKSKGFKVIHKKEDFYTNYSKYKFDCIVSNPPWSDMADILQVLQKINKPFALLCPIDRIGRRYFTFTEHVQLVVINKSVKYIKNGQAMPGVFGKPSAWLCYKMNLKHDLEIVR